MPQEAPSHDTLSARHVQRYGTSLLLLQADQTVEKDPFADLDDLSDLGTGDTTADEAGPSSLPLKENLRPATERISAHTRGGQERRPDLRPDLLDTRSVAEPSLKGRNGNAGSAVGGRLRSAAPKEGTEPQAFYGSGGGAGTQQLREDSPAPPRRQSTRGQKRKAEQVRPMLLPPSAIQGVKPSSQKGSASLKASYLSCPDQCGK